MRDCGIDWVTMRSAVPVPVHLHEVLDDLALNPALPADLVRRMSRYRRGRGNVASGRT